MENKKINIDYQPRQVFDDYHNTDKRWSVIVAHRRAGKTTAALCHLLMHSLDKTDGRFAFISPYYSQSKDIAWQLLLQYNAPLLENGLSSINESELRIDFFNGSRIRLYGSDNYNRLRGLGFNGVVIDEYADCDPRAYPEVIRPALSSEMGFCTWIGTAKGHNAFYEIYQRSLNDPDFYSLMLKASQTGILRKEELDAAHNDLTQDQYNQEYECSFDAAIQGAYYGEDMRKAEEEGRVGITHHEKELEVHTAWDLGVGDATSIVMFQIVGNEYRIIDYYESSGVGLDHYVKVLKDKPYIYGQHILPHDIKVRELSTGKSRLEVLNNLGIKAEVCPNLTIEDGIQAVRGLLDRCWFDRKKCDRLVEALKQYRRNFDERTKTFKVKPAHDWTSHPCDAFRMMAVGYKSKTNYTEVEVNTGWIV